MFKVSLSWVVFSLFFLCGSQTLAAPGIQIQSLKPDYASGKYQESSVDLSVKVTGGFIQVSRSFVDGQWRFNRGAEGAQLSYAREGDAIPESVDISGITYRIDPNSIDSDASGDDPQAVYLQERNNGLLEAESQITKTENNFEWSDSKGNWLSYDGEGQLIEGGDRNTVITQTTRDAQNRIFQVLDAHDNLVMTYEYQGVDSDKIIKIEDYTGRSVSYQWNGDQLTSVTDVRGKTWAYEYTLDGNISARIDPLSNRTKMAYVGGVLTRMTTPNGINTSYSYDYDETRKRYYMRAEDDTGRILEYWYNQDGLLLKTSINGLTVNSTTESADGLNTIRTYTKVGGRSYTQTFNGKNQLIKAVHPDGSIETAEYLGPFNRISKHTDARGEITQFSYDDNGNLITLIEGLGTALQRSVDFTYDEFGQRLSAKYPEDGVTMSANYNTTYDMHGNPDSSKSPLGHTTHYEYSVLGKPKRLQTPAGQVTSAAYDEAGNILSIVDPLNRSYSAVYDDAGQRTSVTYPNGRQQVFEFDTTGRMVSQKALSADGVELTATSMQFNDIEREVATLDAFGNAATQRYNELGQVVYQQNRAGEVTQANYEEGILTSLNLPHFNQYFTYDIKGQANSQTLVWGEGDDERLTQSQQTDTYGAAIQSADGEGNGQQRTYDIFGRVTNVVDALGGKTQFSYDSRNNLLSVTDAEGRITSFEYNQLNLKISESKTPAAGVINKRRYAYNGNGQMIRELLPSGHLKQFAYDAAGQNTIIRFYHKNTLAGVNSSWWAYNWSDIKNLETEYVTRFYYNDMGQVTQLKQDDFEQTFTYTGLGQVAAIETTYPNGLVKAQSYEYDKRGQKTSYTNPEGITYQYSYTANGEIEQVIIPYEGTVSYRGYQSGKPASVLLPGGNQQNMTYDGLGRLTSKDMLDPAGDTLGQMVFDYDKAHNILSIQREFGKLDYSYDSLYRLTSATHPVLEDEVYQYDLVHNRTHRTLTQSDGSETSDNWSYNGANQLTEYSNVSFGYNADGHTIRKSVCTYDDNSVETCEHEYYLYDSRERMVGIEQQTDDGDITVVAEYKYNALGQRYYKKIATTEVYFLYDQTGLLAEYNSAGELIKEYHYTPNSTFMTNPLFQYSKVDDEYFYYLNDHLGTSKKMISRSGSLVWSALSVAFGSSTVSGNIDNNLRFPGQYYDVETNKAYNYYRDYDAELGRYIQSDPIGLSAGINIYGYVGQNPLRSIDPLGLWEVTLAAYRGVGFHFSVGQNPKTDEAFLNFTLGFGFGGGFSYDPDGGGIPGEGDIFIGVTGGMAAAIEGGALQASGGTKFHTGGSRDEGEWNWDAKHTEFESNFTLEGQWTKLSLKAVANVGITFSIQGVDPFEGCSK